MQHLELADNMRYVLEKLYTLVDSHIENVGNGFAFESNLECLAVVAFATAGIALYVDIGQEIHLERLVSVAVADRASPARNIEREASRFVAAYLAFVELGKEVAYVGEDIGIRHGVRTRYTPYGALVYFDDFVEMLESFYSGVR